MGLFQDTNIVACNRPFVAVGAIEVADATAFVEAYDQTNAVASDPMVLEFVDLSLCYDCSMGDNFHSKRMRKMRKINF